MIIPRRRGGWMGRNCLPRITLTRSPVKSSPISRVLGPAVPEDSSRPGPAPWALLEEVALPTGDCLYLWSRYDRRRWSIAIGLSEAPYNFIANSHLQLATHLRNLAFGLLQE